MSHMICYHLVDGFLHWLRLSLEASTTMITPTFDFVALLPQFLHDQLQLWGGLFEGKCWGFWDWSSPIYIGKWRLGHTLVDEVIV